MSKIKEFLKSYYPILYYRAWRKKRICDKALLLTNEEVKTRLHRDYQKFYRRIPNDVHPQYFSEVLLWQKEYFSNFNYSDYVDKIKVKEKVQSILNENICLKTLRVFKGGHLDFAGLPDKFVLKCNHTSGHVFLAKKINNEYRFTDPKSGYRKRHYNEQQMKKIFRIYLKTNYFGIGFEYPYKQVEPFAFAEEFMNTKDVVDFKFFMNNGKLLCYYVVFGRLGEVHSNYYDSNGVFMDVDAVAPPDQHGIKLPNNIDKMIAYAEKLSKGFPLVRVDFYNYNNKPVLGEMTFFHENGMVHYKRPADFDLRLGKMIDLSPFLKK